MLYFTYCILDSHPYPPFPLTTSLLWKHKPPLYQSLGVTNDLSRFFLYTAFSLLFISDPRISLTSLILKIFSSLLSFPSHPPTTPPIREYTYLMIYRGPGFLTVYDLAPPPSSLPSPVSKLDRRHTGRLRKRENFLTEEGAGGGRSRKKAYSSINHSLLFASYLHFLGRLHMKISGQCTGKGGEGGFGTTMHCVAGHDCYNVRRVRSMALVPWEPRVYTPDLIMTTHSPR